MPRTRARRSRGNARRGQGLPARVIPVEVHHIASVGLDVWLAALALGRVAGRGARDRRRGAAVPRGAGVPDADRRHHRPVRSATRASISRLVDADARARRAMDVAARRSACGSRRTFAPTADKRTTAALALEHLARARARSAAVIALPAGAPYGDDRDQPRRLHDVPRVRRLLPGGRDPRQPRDAASAVHRDEVRAVRHLRRDVSGARDRARAAARSDPGGARRPRVLNEAAIFAVHPRAASRSARRR